MSQCDLDKGNIIDFTDEELSPEVRQAMEDFMKQRAERDCQEVEKLMKEKAAKNRLHYLSRFKKTREGKVKKTLHLRYHPMCTHHQLNPLLLPLMILLP
jgi:hypothetical protein